MSTIVVQEFITLDGVVQAPGLPDEDREGGFPHGGWAMAHDGTHDPAGEMGAIIGAWEQKTEALLLGRKTYDIWAASWGVWDEDAPGPEAELTRRYNRVPKHVASRSLTTLGWKRSHLLGPDVPAAVAALRAAPGGELRIWGSTSLVHLLAAHHLIDEYRLAVYPLVLGTGKKLFGVGFDLSRLTLASSRALASGVVVNTYRPTASATA